MWLFAMFDLPVDEPVLRREYTQFRKSLLKHGFTMLQYSVYVHYVRSEESEAVYRKARFRRFADARPGPASLRHGPSVRKDGGLCWKKASSSGRSASSTHAFLKSKRR